MGRGAQARLFVAVDPPEQVRGQLHDWARRAVSAAARARGQGAGGELRVLEPDSMHVTLCFLGARPVEEIEAIDTALQGCPAVAGQLALGAPLWLPPRRPRVLAVEVHDPSASLQALHTALARALAQAIGWRAQQRRLRAHVTVARTRGRAGARRLPGGSQLVLPPTPALGFTPGAVVLYRSFLSPGGASYQALAERELAGAGG